MSLGDIGKVDGREGCPSGMIGGMGFRKKKKNRLLCPLLDSYLLENQRTCNFPVPPASKMIMTMNPNSVTYLGKKISRYNFADLDSIL